MTEEKLDKKDHVIKALEACLSLYLGKSYEITGLLGPETSFTVSINGPFGKKELTYLANRFRADAEHMGDGKINQLGSPKQIIEKLKEAASLPMQDLPSNKSEDTK